MAAIKIKRSSVAGKIPATTDLELGELAINTYDGKIYLKKNNGSESVVELGASTGGGGGTGSIAIQNRYEYVASSAQTGFSASYTAPYLDVYYNGVKLTNNVDYTATNGTSVVLAVGAVAGDNIDIVAYTSVDTADFVSTGTLTGYLTAATAASTYQPIGSYLTSISSSDVTTALGFTPYNATNPSNYITASALTGYLTAATAASTYQPILVSNTNIKTVNGTSLLGSGNISTNSGVPASFGITIDGGGSVITTGTKGYVRVPYDCTITGWTLVSDISGSIVIDVWKDSYVNYPPTLADSIAGSEKPTLTSAIKNENSAVTTWSTTVAAGDIIGFSVTSVTTVQKVYLSINTIKV